MLRTLPLVAGSAALLLTLSACGGSSSGTTASQGQSSDGYGQGGVSGSQGRGMPGAFGKIAAKAGRTLQVQSQQSGQTAVTFSSATAITREVSASLKDLKVGDCAMAVSGSVGSSSSSSGTITARSVRIISSQGGGCADAFGGDRRGGARSGVPSGAPSGAPSGGPSGGRGGFGGGAFGAVTAVTTDGFRLKQSRPGASSSTATTVIVSGSTTWTATAKGTAAALKVGRCVSAQGRSDDTGAVTAQRISVSDPVGGQCTGGFGFGRPPGAGQGSGPGQSGQGT